MIGPTVDDEAELQPSRLRVFVCWAAIVSTLPYFVLKLLWLGSSTVGLTDPTFAGEPSVFALNLFTAFMDLVAIVLVLAFTYPWGQRLPGWLVLFPIWVGTGFLAPIILAVPISAVTAAVTGERSSEVTGPPLESWVEPVVYGSFVLLGVLLLTAFVLYARFRWFETFSDRSPGMPPGRWAAVVGTVLALVAATVLLSWAMSESPIVPSAIVLWTAHAAFALAAVGGIWALQPVGVRRFLWPMLLAWAGSGAMFSWGFWSLTNIVGDTALVVGEVGPRAIIGASAQLLGGALLGVVLAAAMRRVTGAAAPW